MIKDMRTILKIVVAIILILNVLVLTSCRSGWSCKKRYVEVSKKNIELKPLS